MIVVSKYNTINGNVTSRSFRKVRIFQDEDHMERERRRLQTVYGDQVAFSDRAEVPEKEVDNYVNNILNRHT